MKVCILGDGLTSLTLAKTLVNIGINVDILSDKKSRFFKDQRTIGISKSNIEFFNENILNIEKLLWKINKIEIYSKNIKDEKILNFENNGEQLFSIIRNSELYNLLKLKLLKNKFFKFKNYINIDQLLKKDYGLIINCDQKNNVTKKFFFKKLSKNYNSYAYTTTIKHKKILKNDVATQVFTERGPLAFLPISEIETSVVFSAQGTDDVNLVDYLEKFNNKYSSIKLNKVNKVELKSFDLRCYKYKNILAFGDLLHRIHPLAGQGFNMSMRDINSLLYLINTRINNGLEIDQSICSEFEKKNKHTNYLFSNGIDLIYEFFNLESKLQNSFLSKSLKFLGKNKQFNNLLTKVADRGIRI